MRFRAPPREGVNRAVFDHPVFAGVQPWRELLNAVRWPSVAEIDVQLASCTHLFSGQRMRAAAQTPALLADGLHYESRTFQSGHIATREGSWHDLLNALIWLAHGDIKSALNARQVDDIERVGPRQRTRGQCALTHFDEAGVVLVLREPSRLAAWDQHDWLSMFAGLTSGDFAIAVIGHALLEHALVAEQTLVGKALVVLDERPQQALTECLPLLAQSIHSGHVLADPQDLRPLPLMGLPGWHSLAGQQQFLESAPCFAAKRASRVYPPALEINAGALNVAA